MTDLRRVVVLNTTRINTDPTAAFLALAPLANAVRSEFAERRRQIIAADLADRVGPQRHADTARRFGMSVGILNQTLKRPAHHTHPDLSAWVTLRWDRMDTYNADAADHARELSHSGLKAARIVGRRRSAIAHKVVDLHGSQKAAAAALGMSVGRLREIL